MNGKNGVLDHGLINRDKCADKWIIEKKLSIKYSWVDSLGVQLNDRQKIFCQGLCFRKVNLEKIKLCNDVLSIQYIRLL